MDATGMSAAHGDPVPDLEPTKPSGLSGRVVVERDGFHLDVELDMEDGQTLAVVGPNGSGKSTLIGAIAGLLPLTGGTLSHRLRTLDNPEAEVFVPAEDRGFALVPQDGVLLPHLSVLDNVGFGLRHVTSGWRVANTTNPNLALGGRRGRPERDRRAIAALEAVGMAGSADRRPGDLSGGQAQRVAVARALALEAPVLLLDEPLSNIDVDNRQMIRNLLRSERPIDQIQVVVTHGRDHVFDADVVLAIEAGLVLATGKPIELAADPPAKWVADLFDR